MSVEDEIINQRIKKIILDELKDKDNQFVCWLSDWFMASRNDAKEYHCSKIGFSEQCGYCANRDNLMVSFIHVVKEN